MTTKKTAMTPQTEFIPGREKQMKKNSAGGVTFAVDMWSRLDRFLILGSSGGSYYAGERELTMENAQGVAECVKADGLRTVGRIVEISKAGRAPKNDPAILSLAIAMSLGDDHTKAAARAAVPQVCRIGTHIFQYAEAVQNLRGWGNSARRSVELWYKSQKPDKLAMNLVKYQNRNGWSHKDLLRQSHAKSGDELRSLFHWVTRDGDLSAYRSLRFKSGTTPVQAKQAKEYFEATGKLTDCVIRVDEYPAADKAKLPELISGFEEMRRAKTPEEAVKLIEKHGLPRETVPTELLNSVEVWNALLMSGDGMPMTAMLRNLAKMTSLGLISQNSEATKFVVQRLRNVELLKKARVHPLNVLLGMTTYKQGHGLLGKLSWQPVSTVLDGLNDAFYGSFDAVEPTGKRHLLSHDVSGSMTMGNVAGTPLTPHMVTGCMSMVTARTEESYAVMAFGGRYAPIDISPTMRLDQVVSKMHQMNFGSTDCSLPMKYALERKIPVDVFHVYTDNETYGGHGAPAQWLQKYRDATGIPAKLCVVGIISNGFTIADPNDAGMLDVVGFDTAAPAVMAEFARQ